MLLPNLIMPVTDPPFDEESRCCFFFFGSSKQAPLNKSNLAKPSERLGGTETSFSLIVPFLCEGLEIKETRAECFAKSLEN